MTKLNVPYAEKDEARRLGARWNAESKTWYVPAGAMLTTFERWLPKFDEKPPRGARKPRKRRSKQGQHGAQGVEPALAAVAGTSEQRAPTAAPPAPVRTERFVQGFRVRPSRRQLQRPARKSATWA